MLAITNASPEGLNFSTSTTVVRLRRIFSGLGLEEDLGKQMFKYQKIRNVIIMVINLRAGRE